MGLYDQWKQRAYIRITNPATGIANYQHALTLTWRIGMRHDFRDIRFTTTDGQKCSYWIETYTARVSATVWIKVPPSGQAGIFLYYGNGQAASESSGDNTFDFFDHFDGSTLDTTTKWDRTAVAPYTETVSGSILRLQAASAAGDDKLFSKTQFGPGYVCRFNAKFLNHTSGMAFVGFRNQDANIDWAVWACRTDKTELYTDCRNEGTSAASGEGTTGEGAYTNYDIYWKSTAGVDFYRSGTLVQTTTSYVPNDTNLSVFLEAQYSTEAADVYIDWIFARKYATTVPTLSILWHGVNPTNLKLWMESSTLPYAGTEYVFDPVNINHGMVAGIGAQEVEMTNNINHGMVVDASGQDVECGAVNIYHPIYPTATMSRVIVNPTDESSTLIGVTISQGHDDAMARAVFEHDGNSVGNWFSGDYMTQLHVKIPDYLGTSNCVFVGICPSSRAKYEPAKDKMTMEAVDYRLYLTKQVLEDKDLALLPPADQTAEGSTIAKVLDYDTVTRAFQIGMHVTGSTSRATGTIYELVQGDGFRRMTLYPATGVFVDDEQLTVGGMAYALADGRSVDIPYTPYYETISPEDWVRSVLGGDNWMRVTGIEPYKLVSTGGYWDTEDCPAVPFMFGSKETKFDAIKRLSAYMGYIFLVKPRDLGNGNYAASAYWVKESDIDDASNGLDLPAAATITGPNDSYLAAPIELEQNGENQVDRVKVCCQDIYGNWLTAIRTNSRVDYGEGPFREFYDEPQDICTQADLNTYADDMYTLYAGRASTWHATLLDRSDLQLYQLLTISGFGIEIPDGTYRIIKIAYEYGAAVNKVHISFMLSSAFSTLLRYGMTYTDSINEVQRIAKYLEDQKPQNELATVTANDGWTICYETEAGNLGRGRDSTSTPDTSGCIPIGAKVDVKTIRGGVVCIPILGADAYSTSLLTVDVPTIISAAEDPDDANYWFLIWTPGANNTNVSVNVQTTGYPSAAGTVLPYGNTASCFTKLVAKSTIKLRIRFSGPNTTYYIKLWGEKNGVYSATGAQATIVSGSTVTPMDSPEEPEPIGVVDEFLASGFTSMDPVAVEPIFSGALSFSYDGVSNIYIGGPVEDTVIGPFAAANGIESVWIDQPTPRYFFNDCRLKITGPNGTIYSRPTLAGHGWQAPILISSILATGTNTLTIDLQDRTDIPPPQINPTGVSDLWIRTYYL